MGGIMAILVCSPTIGGCGFIGKANEFRKDGTWIYCPKCHEDHTFQVTPENILDVTKDEDSQKKAFELLASDQRQKLKDRAKNSSELIIRPKSSSQKDDCLYSNCPNNKSTHEVILGVIAVRCCNDKNCKKFATDIAKSTKSKQKSIFENELKQKGDTRD